MFHKSPILRPRKVENFEKTRNLIRRPKVPKARMTVNVTRRHSMLRARIVEIAIYVLLGLTCWLTSWFLIRDGAFEQYSLTALFVYLASCIAPLLWPSGGRGASQDSLSIMILMGFRFSILLGALSISAATRWQHHNSFCNCLLGYYFPFLILQSALLIRNQSIQHPPQS